MLLKKKYLTGWLIFGSILFISYYLLGGFTKVDVVLKQEGKFYITGKKYHGAASDNAFDKLVEATHVEFSEGIINGTFSICFYGNPDELDSLTMLVGVMHHEKQEVPSGYIQEVFNQSQTITASIAAEAVVAPSATATNEKITAFAKENNLTLSGVYIERYEEDFKIVTVAPVK